MKHNIQLGVSTWLWESPFNTKSCRLFPKIKQMGFDVVEIPVEDPGLINGDEVKKSLEDNGLKAVVCGAFGPSKDLTHQDISVHQDCFDYIEKCFELCNKWESQFLAGPMYSAVGKARMLSGDQRQREWDLAVDNIHQVCVVAQEHGLSIALEPLNRFESDMINTAEDVMRFIEDVNHSSAKVLLDGFHMTIEEKNIREAIQRVGDKLIHVQVSENHRGIPGTGLTPWDQFVEGLQDIEYQGSIVIESFTPEIKELAGAVCIWKNFAESQDEFASKGIHFLKETFN